MATTIPHTFTGTPILTDKDVATVTEWYESSLRDLDKCDTEDHDYYAGLVDAYHSVLHLLHKKD